ncbi:3-phosphoshikimate 1-carboxyvinyltransferase [Bacillus sp. SG-1]|uniref:3-phosphoshikimate 1-carboxyvinyltransferase n=1 Tax=Bacillus sp. SG-1 TaxID=161544 RepID=UPI00015450CC|nr:3-phosphoshikimate 1-carboxyvinyltransferase [Bacillus sp. SG-1]EDL63187.1 3-phosphoshikimate 1-carboxyvinyltransferase [Bacillus sp. SG-1]
MEAAKKLAIGSKGLRGQITVPGDKSISHRSIMFGAVANGTTVIHNFLRADDCLSTMACFRKMGVEIKEEGSTVIVHGKGWDSLQEPESILDVGNSGTTARLMSGILSGRPFHSVIVGDESIAKRPMKRVTGPLSLFGADIDGRKNGQYTPLAIRGGELSAVDYNLTVASAQVKSAVIFAALQAEGISTITEPVSTRNHTETMIGKFGGEITSENNVIKVKGGQDFHGTEVQVPADISSGAFFLAAAAIVPDSKLVLPGLGLNPTRTGIIKVLEEMGAKITVEMEDSHDFEPRGTVTVETSSLKGIDIGGDIIPSLIDEIPVIALLATQAEGRTVIRDAEELKVKETNRIDAVVSQLKILGADIESTEDGMIINGKTSLRGGTVDSLGDHRIGMTLAIAALLCNEDVELKNAEAVNISYPSFYSDLASLG